MSASLFLVVGNSASGKDTAICYALSKISNLKKAICSLEGLTDMIIVDGAPGLTNENLAILEYVT